MPTLEDLQQARIKKLYALKSRGIDPYPSLVKRDNKIDKIASFIGKNVAIAGRLMGIRGHGKIVFGDLVDEGGKVQIALKSDSLSSETFALVRLFDLGDFLAVQGEVGKTQAGELTVFATDFQIISKSLRPLPDQWHGLKDIEDRYRQRYVDLVMNESVRDIFKVRAKVVKLLRERLDQDGFLEVETPVLQPVYGGASAKPFMTHHNALDCDLYLRISDELYLKRLIIGGFDKVYEIGHDFRNEGIDSQHNPEFTMLEFYWAYADYEKLMQYTEQMLSALVIAVKGTMKVLYQGVELDFSPPWHRKTYRDVVMEYSGIDLDTAKDEKTLVKAIKDKKISLDLSGAVGYGAILDELYKSTARPHLTGPMFLTDRPTAFVTLAKRLPNDPFKTASFQLLVAGKEVINAYNELNDPVDQATRWHESEKLGEIGQEEHEAFDRDYIRALEYGMPPTAGWGMGIDRLVSILTDQASLKDVILFPALRPEEFIKKPISPTISTNPSTRSLNITRDQALALVNDWTKSPSLVKHMLAVEAIMRALAKHFSEDEELWGLAGLLHDADYEQFKDDPKKHPSKIFDELEKRNVDKRIIDAIKAHAWGWKDELPEPATKMEWALYTCDELSGFIIANALVRPDKKLASLDVTSIMKKWPQRSFASGVKREHVVLCKEKLGIPMEEYVSIALTAMQKINQELGL